MKMEKQFLKGFIASFLVMMMLVMVSACGNQQKDPPPTVDSVGTEIDTTLIAPDTTSVVYVEMYHEPYQALVTEQSNNAVKRGASGALIGAGASYLLGGSIMNGGLLGGSIGLATSPPETVSSHYETIDQVKYRVMFSDGSVKEYDDFSPYKIGDKKKSW